VRGQLLPGSNEYNTPESAGTKILPDAEPPDHRPDKMESKSADNFRIPRGALHFFRDHF
jgi:hypothetical protein